MAPLANLLALDPEPRQQLGEMAWGQGVALGVVGPRTILERGYGGEEVAEVGEEPHGGREVCFDDGPGERASDGPRETGPGAAGLVRDGEQRAPVIGLAIVEALGDGGVRGL